MVHMIERSPRAHVHEMLSQLHQHPGASGKKKDNLGSISVPVKTVSCAVQEHEEVIRSGLRHGQRHDFLRRISSTLTVPER